MEGEAWEIGSVVSGYGSRICSLQSSVHGRSGGGVGLQESSLLTECWGCDERGRDMRSK